HRRGQRHRLRPGGQRTPIRDVCAAAGARRPHRRRAGNRAGPGARAHSLHGGTVEGVSRGPGQGSAFTIRLPGAQAVARNDEAEGAARPRRHAEGRCRLLVADDNQDSAESLAMVMRMWGYEVYLAHTGSRALELALRERPDACILDIGMPGLNGYEVASR